MKNYYEQVDENKFRSGIVIALFIAFIATSAYAITYAMGFDPSFIGIALIISGIMSFASFYFSDSIILTISSAVPATKKDFFDFYTVTENLVSVARIPMPKLYVIEDTAMNAFATGRDPRHAIVAATSGLIEIMDDNELQAVMAHEMGHVKNYDIRLMAVVAVLAGTIAFFGLAALVIQPFIRRKA